MKLYFTTQSAIGNLFSAKLRSLLAILGILIGTGSVVALISSGQLATQAALAEFKSLGTNLLSVSIYSSRDNSPASQSAANRNLTLRQALDLSNASPEIERGAPYTNSYANVSYQGHPLNASVIGGEESLADIIKISLQSGRFVSLLDRYQPYCVIGQQIYQQLQSFGIENPLGTQIQMGNNIYTIVGIANQWPENAFFDQDINQSIIVPIQNSLVISKYTQITNLVFRLREGSSIDVVKDALTQQINTLSPGKSVFIRSAKEIIQKMQAQQQTFTILLGVIGGISLLVGGIGVMNIMLVSVTERRREIGIRRALGARKRDIQLLFLIEAVILTLFGGIVGILLGILASYIIAKFSHWQFEVFMIPALIGFCVSVAIGIFFGFYPAYRAAQLDPIQALRTD